MLKIETVHFVNSVKLVSVYMYVKLLKALEPKVSETEAGFDITNMLHVKDISNPGHFGKVNLDSVFRHFVSNFRTLRIRFSLF